MSQYTCSVCGRAESRLWPQCPGCNGWGTFRTGMFGLVPVPVNGHSAPPPRQHTYLTPVAVAPAIPVHAAPERAASIPIPITHVSHEIEARATCGIEPVDRVLGGGFVTGSAILISGSPGAGKSSLIGQVISGIGQRVLYATAEESVAQAAMRARRIGAAHDRILIVSETDIDRILAHAATLRPAMLAIDSIQTVTACDVSGIPGSVAQVKACAARVVEYGKAHGVATLLIGHVTKDGGVAGPKTLEHLVDVVLSLEIDDEISASVRFLRAHKNRYGSTMEVGALEMTATGMIPCDALPSEEHPGSNDDRDAIYQPLAQELLNRYQAQGGAIDAGLKDRIGELLDLEMWRETRYQS